MNGDFASLVNTDSGCSGVGSIADAVHRVWGYSELRPLQAEAIRAGLDKHDSLVVMPTGGGKSLCYQVPPLVAGRTDVVVSPLISLMKDQVDALCSGGYPAAALHSGIDPSDRRRIEIRLLEGELRLLFVAPERLMQRGFLRLLERSRVRSFAVDEAHCISHWGHDFRPEYRQLASLREVFPDASLHAFTATATPQVRDDIVKQLDLLDPLVLVGTFDRPNLVFRILPQVDLYGQVLEVVRRHHGEAVIIYCLSRSDTESMASTLNGAGIKAEHYHAGMDAQQRRRTQEAFAAETVNVVAATVAFGMGIDRSNVRCVVHATMPKSVEHYQQETGRAGRDGLEAECVLLYSAADVIRWKSLIKLSAENAEQPDEIISTQEKLLRKMQALCNRPRCRHAMLSTYFGQEYEKDNCGACDVCLNEVEGMEDATVMAQKILSCVARTGERFGIGYVVDVLGGANTEAVRSRGHDQLSTYGLMRDVAKKQLISMIYQMVDQEVVDRTDGDRPILVLNDHSWQVMHGDRSVQLLRPKRRAAAARTRIETDAWEGVDRDLLEHLRELRRMLASARGVPPYVVFEDTVLRELSRRRPTTLVTIRSVKGMGDKRVAQWGQQLVDAIGRFAYEHELETDLPGEVAVTAVPPLS